MAGAYARLARRRPDELCGPGCRHPFVSSRLSRGRSVARRRGRQELVRPGEVAPVVSSAAYGNAGRDPPLGDLRRSRLLTPKTSSPKAASGNPIGVKAALAATARAHGFDVVGVTRPDAIPHALPRLQQFLAEGAHGDMHWLQTTADRRGDPHAMWAAARSIIMLGVNYGSDGDPLAILRRRDRGAISVYAQSHDYHDVIKPRLKQLASWLIQEAGGEAKVFVDTAAVMEKPLANAAGLGWQGKHTNLVSREFGSWLFLGAIFTTLELPPDSAGADHCGNCRACLDVCPTNAFPAPYRLDARRCISYLTIEHKGPIPR